MMRYAEVSVNSPAARRRTFSYAVPEAMNIIPGQGVLVPFGEKMLQGIVMELTALPAVEDVKDILGIIDPIPILSEAHIKLARWISDYYLSPLFDCVALMLPPGFERNAVAFISLERPDTDVFSLDDDQKKVIELVAGKAKTEVKKIEKTFGKKKAGILVSQMVKQGILSRSYELSQVRAKPKMELYIKIGPANPEKAKLSAGQLALINYLWETERPMPWANARKKTGCDKTAANKLAERSLVIFEEIETSRSPISYNKIPLSFPLSLTPAQQSVFEMIKLEIARPDAGKVFLLRGVTASGKTEIYLQLLADTIKQGKKGIILVPEIALTPQTIERVASRFPGKVGVLHSKLTLGEQYDEWRHIKKGDYDVVIGSRSAIFAPMPDLGLIVIDEEHEWTYKQDNLPHYHARSVAIKLSGYTGAAVVLGSATPDVESYFKAKNGEYHLIELPERAVSGTVLPHVDVIDMRGELKVGNTGVFSRSLAQGINNAVAAGEQVILFLNRRGGAYYIQCRRCGYVLRCRRCDVPLSHHSADNALVCHQCNYKTRVPEACPNCGNHQLKFLGAGTQKLEEEVKAAFPRARQLRWDSDTTSEKSANDDILEKFRSRQADILIGTQIIAKGLDIPAVTLVGVVNADSALNLPDFRAVERTFQLLTQVAGRAGRGAYGGRVVVQTYTPDNYAIHAAAGHDYITFYEREIEYRKLLHNPPFNQLARLLFTHANDEICKRETEKMKKLLLEQAAAKGIGGIDIIGPAPAFIHKLRGKNRWQLVLRGSGLSGFLAPVDFIRGWSVDIDPVGMIQ
jgi:primosomal protein N' (replication factor Y) (superfamily II helicase)